MRRIALSVIALALAGPAARPVARVQDPPAPAAPSQAYTFATGAGILFFYVRPDRTSDFEAVLARLSDALDATQEATRRQQAASWRMFKSVEAVKEAAIYVFAFDPALPGADYDPVKFLGETMPVEAQALYEKLKASITRVERMGLTRLR